MKKFLLRFLLGVFVFFSFFVGSRNEIMAAVPAYLQSRDSYSTGYVSSRNVTFTNAVANGNLVIVAVSAYRAENSPVINSVTDNKGNVYTKISQVPVIPSGDDHISLWYANNVVGGSSFRVTSTPSQPSYVSIAIHEYSGLGAVDQVRGANGSGASSDTGITSPTLGGNELVFGAIMHLSFGNPSATAGTGFTIRRKLTNRTSYQSLVTEDRSVVSTGEGFKATLAWGSSVPWQGIVAVLRSSDTPTPTPSPTPTPTPGQHPVVPGQQVAYTSSTADRPYLLFLPNNYSTQAPEGGWPTIVFLHGYGIVVAGDDVNLIRMEDLPSMVDQTPDFQFVVVSPRLYSSDAPNFWLTDSAVTSIMSLIDEIQANYNVNAQKLNLTGYSMGAGATWNIALKYPSRFHTVAPAAGFYGYPPYVPSNICDLAGTPIWAFHGALDDQVPLSAQQQLVDAVRACGNTNVNFSIFPNRSHMIGDLAFYNNYELYNWMMSIAP